MKDKPDVAGVKEFFGLKLRTYSFLLDDSKKHKKGCEQKRIMF